MEEKKAGQKFLNIPEVVEKLISSLDPSSTLHLAQSEVLSKDVFQKSLTFKVWKELVEHAYNSALEDDDIDNWIDDGDSEVMVRQDVMDLVEILKLMELEDPSAHLIPLLHLVSEVSSVTRFYNFVYNPVEIICPCRPEPHVVHAKDVVLLEEVEGALGTTVQSIKSIKKGEFNLWEAQLLALSSRVSRQKEMLTSIEVRSLIIIENKGTVEAFAILLQAESAYVEGVRVKRAIGEEGWHDLARALESKSDPELYLGSVEITRTAFAEARKDDIKVIWDATRDSIRFYNTEWAYGSVSSRYDWEAAWTRLKQLSDMTEDEFRVEAEKERKTQDRQRNR